MQISREIDRSGWSNLRMSKESPISWKINTDGVFSIKCQSHPKNDRITIKTSECYEAPDSKRFIEKEVWGTLDKTAALALRDFINDKYCI